MDLKKTLPSLMIAMAAIMARAQYRPIDSGSSVQFSIKNFGVGTSGYFAGLQGDIRFDINNLSGAGFSISVDANSVNTGNGMRDGHLREGAYLDVKNYPRISFVSTKISPSNKTGVLFIFGKLTIKGQTKDISFPFTASPIANGYLFKGTFNIDRKDFGVGGTSTISNGMEIKLNIMSTK